MPFRKPSILTPEGESGEWRRVQGRHIFTPTTDASAEEVGDKEVERWEHPTPAFKDEDGLSGGDDAPKKKFQSVEDNLNVRNIHADGAKESETYIGAGQIKDKLPDKNKIADVQLNDTIKYYLNGEEGKGTVYAMTTEFFTVRKESGGYQDIQISDVFFVDQILTKSRTWAHMEVNERADILGAARAPLSYVTRDWADIPAEAQKVIKSNFEQGKYGGIDTSIHFDAPEDYEATEINDDESNFKHDNLNADTSTTESEQVPDSYKKPEVENKDGSGKGDAGTAMMAGVKSDDDIEEEKKGKQNEEYLGKEDRGVVEDLDKENSSMSTGDVGSFNGVHNTRYEREEEGNKIGKTVGVTKSFKQYGIGYGVTKLEKTHDIEE